MSSSSNQDQDHSSYIVDNVNKNSNDMLTILKEKPRIIRVQHNPANNQWMVTIPLEIAENVGLEKGDSVKVFMDKDRRILLEVVK